MMCKWISVDERFPPIPEWIPVYPEGSEQDQEHIESYEPESKWNGQHWVTKTNCSDTVFILVEKSYEGKKSWVEDIGFYCSREFSGGIPNWSNTRGCTFGFPDAEARTEYILKTKGLLIPFDSGIVRYWMPLPEPPTLESTDG